MGSLRAVFSAVFVISIVLFGSAPAAAAPSPSPAADTSQPTVAYPVHMDVSAPLIRIRPENDDQDSVRGKDRPAKKFRHDQGDQGNSSAAPGSSAVPTAAAPSLGGAFEGVGQGFTGPNGTFTVNAAPPDPNGAVGPNHYVEVVNTSFAIFNKTGTPLYGPAAINTLWSGFGGGCQTNNDGDPMVLYDRISDRWILSQFSVSTLPYLQCVAVSTTGDPTGSYFRYSYSYGNTAFPDYPKFGVWPDAYYVTFNIFNNGATFAGAKACGYDRAQMIIGGAATQVCFNTSTAYGGLLPAALDGSRLPPAGAPNYLVSLGVSNNDLAYWRFHADFATPANSTFTGPTAITVAAYGAACNGGTCIPQSGTAQRLDSLADRLMYRLAYRNFGDHESLVVNHSVTAGTGVGVRWYELRVGAGNTLSLFQQGTYAPDSNYRWMGSIAMDQAGNMGLGFSLSGTALKPSIHYTGRLASDPPGTMPQGEGTIIDGTGVQTGSNLSRWGDYTSMAVDPTDDCTFWYTNQYIAANGAFNWHTRVGTFKFAGCGVPPPPPNDFSISATPSSLSVQAGGSGTSTISTAVTSGTAETVALSASGLPANATASFNPTSVTAGGSSTLTIATAANTPTGSYTVTVTGTAPSATHSTSIALTVTAPPPPANDFSISATPSALSIQAGNSDTSTISTAVTAGTAETVSFSASGLPAGATASFAPTSVTAGGSSTLTIATATTTAAGSYAVTVTGTSPSTSHATSIALTVTAPPPPPNDFSISANPSSLSVQQGNAGTSTIATAVTSGTAETVSLSASGVPAGATATFNPTSVTAGGSSTLTVNAGTAAPGSYTVTVTGTALSATHSTAISLTVTAPPPNPIVNGGFETGTFGGWTTSGPVAVVTSSRTGSFAARVGSTSPFSGNATVAQTFIVPAGMTQLSFWYKVVCTDTVFYDWATATLRDNTAGTSRTVLTRTCTNNGTWFQRTASVIAGHSYTLTLIDHDDAYPIDPTYTLFDDVSVQ